MSNKTLHAAAEANRIHQVLRACGVTELPVNVREIALEISQNCFPESPITKITTFNEHGFEGMLKGSPDGKKWAILYNSDLPSKGRINFTLAHEFGHYLLHRKVQNQFECGRKELFAWGSQYRKIEDEANRFASYLLMPIDDYRSQVSSTINIDFFKHCADRYDVSLTAVILKWLDFTERRALLIVSREGYMKWSWSSTPAMNQFLYFKASISPPIEIPQESLTGRRLECQEGQVISSNIWFKDKTHIPKEVKEINFFSEYHDLDMTLLIF